MMHAYCNNCNRRQSYLHIEERKDEKQRRPGSELRERKQVSLQNSLHQHI